MAKKAGCGKGFTRTRPKVLVVASIVKAATAQQLMPHAQDTIETVDVSGLDVLGPHIKALRIS